MASSLYLYFVRRGFRRERSDGSASKASGSGTVLMLYKGQRRHRIELSDAAPANSAETSPSLTSEQCQTPASSVVVDKAGKAENNANESIEDSWVERENAVLHPHSNNRLEYLPESMPSIDQVFPEICSFFEPVSQSVNEAYNALLSRKRLPVMVSLSEFQREVSTAMSILPALFAA